MLKYSVIVYILILECRSIHFIDLPIKTNYIAKPKSPIKTRDTKPTMEEPRRHWLYDKAILREESDAVVKYDNEKDVNLKNKISTLVQQTLHDTDTKIRSVQHLKTTYRQETPYKIGFILSMVKKSRDVLNELFNIAVKHREEWKALEQLKIFELIVHTNVDTTNLVRQLVELHMQSVNNTNSATGKKRVVLL